MFLPLQVLLINKPEAPRIELADNLSSPVPRRSCDLTLSVRVGRRGNVDIFASEVSVPEEVKKLDPGTERSNWHIQVDQNGKVSGCRRDYAPEARSGNKDDLWWQPSGTEPLTVGSWGSCPQFRAN